MISNSANSIQQLSNFLNNKLEELNLPELTYIKGNFQNQSYINSLLQSIDFKNLEQSPFLLLGNNLQQINLNKLKQIEEKSYSNSNLFTNLKYNFLSNTKITELYLPSFEGVKNSGYNDYGYDNSTNPSFINNYWLKDVTLGNPNMLNSTNTHFNGYWFANCYSLKYLKLLYPFVMPVSSNVGFTTNPIGNGEGKIYVPDNLVNDYKRAQNWVTYNSKITPLSQYETDKTAESEIEEDWSVILAACAAGTAATTYKVGQYKTLKINGMPTQMVIVNTAANNSDNRDKDAENNYVQLTWMEKTISRFNTYAITSNFPYSYNNSTVFKNIMNEIYEGIPEGLGLREGGIKEVIKKHNGLESGSSVASTQTDKLFIWPPSIAEIGKSQTNNNLAYDYFKNKNTGALMPPNYRLGATNIYTNGQSNIRIALRDFQNSSNPRSSVLISGQDDSAIEDNTTVNPYIIFGFCT